MKILLITLSFITTCCYCQTVVIGKIIKNYIYVGADSRAIEVKVNGITQQTDTTFSKFCKIKKIGKYYFAVVHAFAEESIELINEIYKNAKDLNELIYMYATNFKVLLQNKLQQLKSDNEKSYYTFYPPDSLLCHTIFFGYETDTAILRGVTFINKDDKSRMKVSAMYWHDSAIAAGEVSEIKAVVKNPKTWQHRNPKNVIYTLIKKQCDTHSTFVGEPINIIQVTKDGYKWLLNGCE